MDQPVGQRHVFSFVRDTVWEQTVEDNETSC